MQTNFTRYLFEHKHIEKFHTGFSEHLRLVSEFICHFDPDKIAFLRNEYTPEKEKGGVIFVSANYKNGNHVLNVEEIIFVTNRSKTPNRSYKPDTDEINQARMNAFKKNLLPFNFHSHPTKHENIFLESLKYYSQLNTSSNDKIYQFMGIQIEEIKLRLPDILIVANGQLKSGLFIGFYSGLVAPLDFTERKEQLITNFTERSYERLLKYFETPQKKTLGIAGGIVAVIGILALLRKFPKAIIPTVITTASIVPMLAYTSTSEENIFFGISNGQSLKITLPRISNEKIIENEKIILQLHEDWKHQQLM